MNPLNSTSALPCDWLAILREKARRANRHGAWHRDGAVIKRERVCDGTIFPVAVCRMNKVVNDCAMNDCAEFIAALDPATVMKLLDMIDGKTNNND